MKKKFSFLIFLLLLSSFIPNVNGFDAWINGAPIEIEIANGLHDATYIYEIDYFDNSYNRLDIQYYQGSSYNQLNFMNMSIPSNATIVSAELCLYSPWAQTSPGIYQAFTVYGIDDITLGSLSDKNDMNIDDITSHHTNVPSWNIPLGYLNITVTDIVQEIIDDNEASWISGVSDLGFMIYGEIYGEYVFFSSYESVTQRPILKVSYAYPKTVGYTKIDTINGYEIFFDPNYAYENEFVSFLTAYDNNAQLMVWNTTRFDNYSIPFSPTGSVKNGINGGVQGLVIGDQVFVATYNSTGRLCLYNSTVDDLVNWDYCCQLANGQVADWSIVYHPIRNSIFGFAMWDLTGSLQIREYHLVNQSMMNHGTPYHSGGGNNADNGVDAVWDNETQSIQVVFCTSDGADSTSELRYTNYTQGVGFFSPAYELWAVSHDSYEPVIELFNNSVFVFCRVNGNDVVESHMEINPWVQFHAHNHITALGGNHYGESILDGGYMYNIWTTSTPADWEKRYRRWSDSSHTPYNPNAWANSTGNDMEEGISITFNGTEGFLFFNDNEHQMYWFRSIGYMNIDPMSPAQLSTFAYPGLDENIEQLALSEVMQFNYTLITGGIYYVYDPNGTLVWNGTSLDGATSFINGLYRNEQTYGVSLLEHADLIIGLVGILVMSGSIYISLVRFSQGDIGGGVGILALGVSVGYSMFMLWLGG